MALLESFGNEINKHMPPKGKIKLTNKKYHKQRRKYRRYKYLW